MAQSDKFNHSLIENTALPYNAAGNPLTLVPSYVDGQNILTSSKNYAERRGGFNSFEATATVFTNDIRRTFVWRRWAGSFFIMLCEVSGTQSIVHKLEIGTDANFISLFTSTSTEPFDFVVSKNQVFFGNGTDMRKYDGTTLTIWGITAPAAAPVIALGGTPVATSLTSPSDTTGSHADWTNPNNIFASDDSRSIDATLNFNNLFALDYSLSVPVDAVISGIEVLVEGNGSAAAVLDRGVRLFLTKDGSATAGSVKAITQNQTTDDTQTSGSSSDLWGTTWTPIEINATTFGVIIDRSSLAAAGDAKIDHVQIRVHYAFSATSGYRYVVAYGNSSTGHISSRTVPSASTGVFTADAVDVTLVASGDAQVDEIHVYRSTDGGGGIYFEVQDSPYANSSATVTDVTPDEDLSSETSPDTTSNDPPPNANGFVWFANRIWMFVDNRVWYTGWEEIVNGVEEESVPSGSDGNFWEFDSEVTGLGVTPESVLVFTATRVYRIEGDERDLFRRTTAFDRVGARERATITSMGRLVAWLDTADNINITDGFSLNTISRLRRDGDTIWTIEPDLTGIDHTQASMTFHNDGDRKWLLLLDGEDSRIRPYDFDNEQWMPPWTVGGRAIHSGETSAGAFDLLAGHTTKKLLKLTPSTYTDDGTAYVADATTNLTDASTSPGKRGALEYLGTETNSVVPLMVSCVFDDDPLLATTQFMPSEQSVDSPLRIPGLDLIDMWHWFRKPPARRVATKIEWIAEDANFRLYSIDFAYKDTEKTKPRGR